jgi:Zn-dependent protease
MPSTVGIELLGSLIVIVIVLVSLSVHEFAHAFVANLFGDPTARLEGRMTLNPLAHWDRIGTTLLVALLILNAFGLPVPVFGWGKPVPIDERNFDNPRWFGLQTALAGPLSNFILAAVLGLLVRSVGLPIWLADALTLAVYLNIFLMLFNLIPVPPLDGSRILRLFISDEIYYALASNPLVFYAVFFLIIFFLLTPLASFSQTLANFLLGR